MAGNIRVFCRCRPLNSKEILAGYATVVDLDAAKDGEIGIISGASAKKLYKFDRVYTPKDDQGTSYFIVYTNVDFLLLRKVNFNIQGFIIFGI